MPGDVPGETHWFGTQSHDQMLVIVCAYSQHTQLGLSGLGLKVRGLTESPPQHSSCDLCVECVTRVRKIVLC